MGQHHALGRTGGAAGELDVDGIVELQLVAQGLDPVAMARPAHGRDLLERNGAGRGGAADLDHQAQFGQAGGPQVPRFGARKLGREDLAGKTGSTNDHRDAWFVGFNGDLSTAVWVGFDDCSSLGRANGVGEFGAQAALPIWMDYMGSALKGLPVNMLPMPPGITTLTIDRSTGLPAAAVDTNTMSEMFKVEDLDRLRSQAAQQQQEQDKQHAYDIF